MAGMEIGDVTAQGRAQALTILNELETPGTRLNAFSNLCTLKSVFKKIRFRCSKTLYYCGKLLIVIKNVPVCEQKCIIVDWVSE